MNNHDDITDLIQSLNDHQREAVTAPPEHRLILAGAGSGKTRVLVHRIAWLIRVENVSPYSIMAVTFTNKAAGEMRARAEELLDISARSLWCGTFHGIAHRFLRQHWREANLPQSFQILDSEDQLRLIRRVMRGMNLDESSWPPKQFQWYISGKKDDGLRPQHLRDEIDPMQAQMVAVYQAYEDACQRAGVVDFAELLLRAHETLRDNAELLAHYRQRFQHILVDEFQDTNALQYAWVRLLAGDTGKVFVVGDDDQSIYGWRGAKIEHIQKFSRDFSQATTVRLEQNYRSTSNILNAANAVIRQNSGRLGKELWTDAGDGEAIQLFSAFNEQEEAQFGIERIREWVAQGGQRKDIAILYRSNAQSRVFEEALISARVPYRIYGGLRFFERQEIKDALAYLRLIESRDADQAFDRVINVPTRGIGNQTVETVRKQARDAGVSLWQATRMLLSQPGLSSRASAALQRFGEIINSLAKDVEGLPLHEQVEHIVEHTGLIGHYEKEKNPEKRQARLENLAELVTAAKSFAHADEDRDEDEPVLTAFLAHAALEAGEGQGDAWEDCVQLMTLHSAKGLEFPIVLLVGLEEGLFPHQNSIESADGLEEERRLAYVGITRAMQRLYISYAERRRLYGVERDGMRSRFIAEIPPELIEEIRPRVQVARPVFGSRVDTAAVQEAAGGFALGQRVSHPKFGEGTVLNIEGTGASARVHVNFVDAGAKWLVMRYANLQVL